MYPKEYIQFLVHFHGDRDYFECHEILEEYWKKTDGENKYSVWVGLIQLAVSCYHHRRGNFNGAQKTLEKAITIFNLDIQSLTNLGLNQSLLICLANKQLEIIEKKEAYQSFNLPISTASLKQQCVAACITQGFIWGSSSDINNLSLVHRHKSRDRSEVIQERYYALMRKRGSE